MKSLNLMIPLAGILALVGSEAGARGGEPQRASTDAVPVRTTSALPGSELSAVNGIASDKNLGPPTYLQDVLPIFMGKCVRCHNTEATVMYNWLDYKTAYGDRWEIRKRVWHSFKGSYYKQPMPAGSSSEAQAMTEEERQTVKTWVETGAAYGVPVSHSGYKTKAERIEAGGRLFTAVCSLCHQSNAQGIPTRFPPLARSDFLNADKNRAIRVLLHGLQGEVVVNGQKFNNSMPSLPLGDDDIANALTFVYHSFGNSGKEVLPEEVMALRSEHVEAMAGGSQKGSPTTAREASQWE